MSRHSRRESQICVVMDFPSTLWLLRQPCASKCCLLLTPCKTGDLCQVQTLIYFPQTWAHAAVTLSVYRTSRATISMLAWCSGRSRVHACAYRPPLRTRTVSLLAEHVFIGWRRLACLAGSVGPGACQRATMRTVSNVLITRAQHRANSRGLSRPRVQ
jgi:hypothetical protein